MVDQHLGFTANSISAVWGNKPVPAAFRRKDLVVVSPVRSRKAQGLCVRIRMAHCSYGQSKSLKRPSDYAHTSRSWVSRGSLSAGCRARRLRIRLRVAAPEAKKTIPAHFLCRKDFLIRMAYSSEGLASAITLLGDLYFPFPPLPKEYNDDLLLSVQPIT